MGLGSDHTDKHDRVGRPDTIPYDGRNLPQRAKYDLYIEQVSGKVSTIGRSDAFSSTGPALSHPGKACLMCKLCRTSLVACTRLLR